MNLMPEKIQLPDVTDEEREALAEINDFAAHKQRQQVGVITAMIRLRKPMARKGRTPRKAVKVTKHSRYAATMRTRSSFLKHMAAMDDYAANTTPGGTWVGEDAA